MLNYYTVVENKSFVGRLAEMQKLQELSRENKAAIVIMYGRRRIGKTELLEQVFRERNILKFEGIEGLAVDQQRQHLLKQLAHYLNEPLIAKLVFDSWTDWLILLYNKTKDLKVTIYFEELQWIANYDQLFISELKYVWDNFFRKNSRLILILCGSSASFIINQVVQSRALYNRSQVEIYLAPFALLETSLFLKNKTKAEILDAYLAIGGVPEYLRVVNSKKSFFITLCQESFGQNGFFVHEYEKIFTSALANNKHYKQIIEFLANQKFATKPEIAKHLKIQPGGNLTNLLLDLEKSDFIGKYTPYNLSTKSHLVRYAIKDQYLQFYYKFIDPLKNKILHGDFNDDPVKALNKDSYNKWQGFAFERFCKNNYKIIAKRLGFSAVRYECGSFYSRATETKSPGYQIDLLFDREDKVITICEIKYLQSKVSTGVIEDFERKIALFPNDKNKTIHKVLISVNGVTDSLHNRGYFDEYLGLEDFFV